MPIEKPRANVASGPMVSVVEDMLKSSTYIDKLTFVGPEFYSCKTAAYYEAFYGNLTLRLFFATQEKKMHLEFEGTEVEYRESEVFSEDLDGEIKRFLNHIIAVHELTISNLREDQSLVRKLL